MPILDFEAWNSEKHTSIVKYEPIDDKNLFLIYNRNPRPHRVNFSIRLLKNDIFERGLLSLGDMNYYDDKTYIVEDYNKFQFDYLKTNAPFTINTKPNLYYNLACDITISDYERTFISIISETLMDVDTIFISEKTWKPIAQFHPFIIFGRPGVLSKLKEFGFKTFEPWIDESYDSIENNDERFDAIYFQVKKIQSLSHVDLIKMIEDMKDILLHNNKLFLEYGKANNNIVAEVISQIKQLTKLI